jgi:aminoglycoside 6'-N-acetyltransferase
MAEQTTARTWDGVAIASDDPVGVVVVVRRPAPNGEPEFLLLHRAHEGEEYAGDWAWTSPAGCRQPGEPVYSAALRELAEEAGLVGFKLWPVDLSWRVPTGPVWALFALDVPEGTVVDLVDPEHDRFEWLSAEEALERVLPRHVGQRQIERVRSIPRGDVSFRRLTYDDLPSVVRWQGSDHVARWWNSTGTVAEAAQKYGPRLRGEEPTRMWVAVLDGRDIGYLQEYRVGDHPDYAAATGQPEAAAFDYLIGEPDLVGKGLGTRLIWEFLRDVVGPSYPDAPRFLASPAPDNAASLRVLTKCGFVTGPCVEMSSGGRTTYEVVCTLDRKHWFG